jgi:nitric oxide synthase oxygenase domain/subunit
LKLSRRGINLLIRELWQDGIYSETQYEQRVREVIREIEDEAVDDGGWLGGEEALGRTGTWRQTPEELQHGLRLAWKNSRKCIMRSHYLELK